MSTTAMMKAVLLDAEPETVTWEEHLAAGFLVLCATVLLLARHCCPPPADGNAKKQTSRARTTPGRKDSRRRER
eukprot:5079906-Prymnesium_polylepis.1